MLDPPVMTELTPTAKAEGTALGMQDNVSAQPSLAACTCKFIDRTLTAVYQKESRLQLLKAVSYMVHELLVAGK